MRGNQANPGETAALKAGYEHRSSRIAQVVSSVPLPVVVHFPITHSTPLPMCTRRPGMQTNVPSALSTWEHARMLSRSPVRTKTIPYGYTPRNATQIMLRAGCTEDLEAEATPSGIRSSYTVGPVRADLPARWSTRRGD